MQVSRRTLARWPWTRGPRADLEIYDGKIYIDCPAVLLDVLYVRQVLGLKVLLDVPPLAQPPSRPADHQLAGVDAGAAAQQCEAHWDRFVGLGARPQSGDAFAEPPGGTRFTLNGRLEAAMRSYGSSVRADALGQLRRDGPRTSGQVVARLEELFGGRVQEQGVRLDLLPLGANFKAQVSPGHYVHDLAGFLRRTERT